MRKPCCEKEEGVVINKGAWSKQEDQKLIDYISVHGEGCWRSLPKAAGLHRCGKSCRLRWINYLRPDIKRGNFDLDEEDLIIKLHALLGNRWSLIAGRLPGRTDNEVKNYWNSHIRKKLIRMGVDPNNHKPHQHRPPRMVAHGSPTSQITESSSSMEDASTNPSNCKNKNDGCNETQGKIIGGGGVRGMSNVVVSCVDHEETSSSAALDLNLDLTIATSPSPSTQLRFLERKEAHANSSKVVKVELEGHEVLEPSPALVLFR